MTVEDCEGKRIDESFQEIGPLDKKQKGWAEWLLCRKLSVNGGGLWSGHAYLQKKGEPGFAKFEKEWLAWWARRGSKKYLENVKKARKFFHKFYVKDGGMYRPKAEVERELTEAETRWIKARYKAHTQSEALKR